MLIAARNGFLAGKRLPYDAEVEYLESTGSQYIDTGVAPNNNIAADISIYWTRTDLNMNPFGDNESINGSTVRFMMQIFNENPPNIYFGAELNSTRGGAGKDKWNDIVVERGKYYNNGTLIDSVPYAPFQFTRTMGLLAYHTSNGFANRFVGRTRYFRMRNAGTNTSILDLIPVRVGSGANAVGYMYDRVSGELFRNQGTDPFVIGPDI